MSNHKQKKSSVFTGLGSELRELRTRLPSPNNGVGTMPPSRANMSSGPPTPPESFSTNLPRIDDCQNVNESANQQSNQNAQRCLSSMSTSSGDLRFVLVFSRSIAMFSDIGQLRISGGTFTQYINLNNRKVSIILFCTMGLTAPASRT